MFDCDFIYNVIQQAVLIIIHIHLRRLGLDLEGFTFIQKCIGTCSKVACGLKRDVETETIRMLMLLHVRGLVT